MWNLKYGTNESIYRKETKLMDMENRLMVSHRREREWDGMGIGVSRCKLLHLK